MWLLKEGPATGGPEGRGSGGTHVTQTDDVTRQRAVRFSTVSG